MVSNFLLRVITVVSVLLQHVSGFALVTPELPPLTPRAAATNSACARASQASASFAAAFPSESTVEIPADLAYACLKSPPNYKDPALELVSSLRAWLQFQSDIEYLRDPPIGRLYPLLDVLASLDNIESNVKAGAYACEYDFQFDLVSTAASAHDGHFSIPLDLARQTFTFKRGSPGSLNSLLVSISADGYDTPQVYLASDLIQLNSDFTKYVSTTGYAASSVISIDDQDVVSFLLNSANHGSKQDPDANWNANFFTMSGTLGSIGLDFSLPLYLTEPTTSISFANGSRVELPNTAIVPSSRLDGVENEIQAYFAFCPNAVPASQAIAVSEEPTATTTTVSEPLPAEPTIFGFPYPVIKHSADMISGYHLSSSEYDDVIVLRMANFQPSTHPHFDVQTYREESQRILERFLETSKQLGKKKLIIDLQQNGGGSLDLGTDFFAQLFPSIPPNSKGNMRASLGLEVLSSIGSDAILAAEKSSGREDEILAEADWVPLAYQTTVKPDLSPFKHKDDFYGPHNVHGGKFTSFFQTNYTDKDFSDFGGTGLVVTGTNERTDFGQAFEAQDMIVLTDGNCASTCTVVTEYLKNYAGVQFITIGGRPRKGAMQAIGGIKGSQMFPWDNYLYPKWEAWVAKVGQSDTLAGLIEDTVWANWSDVAWRRTRGAGAGVNGQNNFRVGDDSHTPLQYVYEAADCRIWYTREMLYDPVFLWERVAEIAFKDRKGKKFTSKYCIEGSTGHPTSIGGGWEKGTLGDQTPPDNARATNTGWKLTGKVVGEASSGGSIIVDSNALKSFKEACSNYSGNRWLVQVICRSLLG